MMTKGLALVDIGQMDFDKRDVDPGQGIANCHAGMGESGGVDNDELHASGFCLVNLIDQHAFVVTLKAIDLNAMLFAELHGSLIDVIQPGMPVNPGFASA